MRKHFLLLFLMALLPLAGFADNITLLPANIQYTYGDNDIPTQQQTATVAMLNVIGALPGGVSAQNVADALQFILQDEITDGAPGSYNYTLVTKDGYQTGALANHTINITGSAQVQILKKDLADNMIQAIAAVTFKNEKWEPAITVKIGNETIDPSNYTVQYGDETHDNIHRGTGYVKITAASASYYRGSAEATFTIKPLALTSVAVGAIADQTYTRSEITPSLTVTGVDANSNQFTLRAADYTASYSGDQTNVGTVKVGLAQTNDGDFTFTEIAAASSTYTFKIVKKNVTDDTSIAFAGLANHYFADAVHTQEGNNALKINWTQGTGNAQTVTDIKDYFTLSYENNTNVGTATIIATANANSNYSGQVVGTYSILPSSIEGAVVAFKKAAGAQPAPATDPNATYTYAGRKIQPGTNAADGYLYVKLGETVLVKGQDYEIVGYGLGDTDDNTNASVTVGNNQKYASVTIKGIGNYDAVDNQAQPVKVHTQFTIAQKALALATTPVSTYYKVSPASKFAKTTGVLEGEDIGGTYTYKVYSTDGNDYTLVDPANYGNLDVSNDKYYYTVTWAANPLPQALPENATAADYDSAEQEAARANYDLTIVTSGYALITVQQASLIIVPDNLEKTFSVADPALTYKVYNGEVAPENEVAINDVNFTTAPTLTRVAGENVKYDTDGETVIGYTISVNNQDAVAAASYTFQFQTGTLKINPFPITITAADQEILYGSAPNEEAAYNSFVKKVENGVESYGTALTVTFSPAATVAGLIDRNQLGLALTWDHDGSMGPHTDALVPSITNKNFAPTCVNGTVTVSGTEGIELVRVAKANLANATVATLVNEYNGKTVNVKIKSTDAATTTFNKNQWYTMVLPFETTTKMISEAFGYAIVDLLRTSNEDATRVYFDLHMNTEAIPANTPFLLKAWDDIDMENDGVTFNNVEITKPAGVAGNGNLFAQDAAGNMFIGTYTGIDGLGDGTHGNNVRVYSYGAGELGEASATYYLRQMSAYITLMEAGARVFVQDLDENGTTVIKELNLATGEAYAVDGWYTLNGVKLQGAPTEKGIYINNGKKVVLK